MRLSDEFFDICDKFVGYEIILYRKDNRPPAVFNMLEDDFNHKKDLVVWLDFLIKTNQWIPYAVYQDLFNLPEDNYPGLRMIKDIQIKYLEYSLRVKSVNIY